MKNNSPAIMINGIEVENTSVKAKHDDTNGTW
jgi:hypothetical protein